MDLLIGYENTGKKLWLWKYWQIAGVVKILAKSWGCVEKQNKTKLAKIPGKNTGTPQNNNNNNKPKTIVVVKIKAMGTRPTVIQQGLKLMFMYKLFPSFRA